MSFDHLSKFNISVLCGGYSSERDISLKSGKAIYDALSSCLPSVSLVDLKTDFKSQLSKLNIDIAFIALHGEGGEDGIVQSVLDDLGIEYVGAGPVASRKSFDKEVTKNILSELDIPVISHHVADSNNWRDIVHLVAFPVFIKPVANGSSIGVDRILDKEELIEKLPALIEAYGRYIIEPEVIGREITVGVLGDKALDIIELVPKGKFYDFSSKYTKGQTEYLVPADFSERLYKRFQSLALKTHQVLGVRDFSRVDLIIDEQDNPYVLELNSVPGFTATSLLPKAALYAGLDFKDLCCTLLSYAASRLSKREQYVLDN